MELQEFIEKFAEAIEIENVEKLSAETAFRELDEWSSLSVMLLIAMFDEEFDKQIGDKEIRQCNIIKELFELVH